MNIPGVSAIILIGLISGAVACTSSTEEPAAAPTTASVVAPTATTAVSVEAKAMLAAGEHTELGKVLVDGQGQTLYFFTRDDATGSKCTGGCATTWPPLLASSVDLESSEEGVASDLLSTIDRDDGTQQVTYNGHPLYSYSGDGKPGDANGHNVGGVWFVVSPKGEAATAAEAVATPSDYSY